MMRTLHVGLRVEDLERSLEFYENPGYEVVGTVPETEFGDLTMLKLPDDDVVILELVHERDAGRIDPRSVSHLVIQVEELSTQSLASAPAASPWISPARPMAPMPSGRQCAPIPTATGSSSSSGPSPTFRKHRKSTSRTTRPVAGTLIDLTRDRAAHRFGDKAGIFPAVATEGYSLAAEMIRPAATGSDGILGGGQTYLAFAIIGSSVGTERHCCTTG
jgi:lactoylglutathione lyase